MPCFLAMSNGEGWPRIRSELEKFFDHRRVLERDLHVVQTRLHHLVELIARGRATDSVIDSLHQKAARKKLLLGELERLDHRRMSSANRSRKWERKCRFTATGTCDRLLVGVKVVDEFGGGQGS